MASSLLPPSNERIGSQKKSAPISCASSGDNSLVAAVTGKRIVVHSIFLMAYGTANTVYFKDAASGTAIFGDGSNGLKLDITGTTGTPGFSLPFSEAGWFVTAAAGALTLNLSAAQGVAGVVVYSEVS